MRGCGGGFDASIGAPPHSQRGQSPGGIRRFQVVKLKNSGEDPVNFFPALYPVEYDRVIIGDFTTDAVLSGPDAPVVFKPFHPVDIKIGKNIF